MHAYAQASKAGRAYRVTRRTRARLRHAVPSTWTGCRLEAWGSSWGLPIRGADGREGRLKYLYGAPWPALFQTVESGRISKNGRIWPACSHGFGIRPLRSWVMPKDNVFHTVAKTSKGEEWVQYHRVFLSVLNLGTQRRILFLSNSHLL